MENQEKKANTTDETKTVDDVFNTIFGKFIEDYGNKIKIKKCIICDELFETSVIEDQLVCPKCKQVIKALRGLEEGNNGKN